MHTHTRRTYFFSFFSSLFSMPTTISSSGFLFHTHIHIYQMCNICIHTHDERTSSVSSPAYSPCPPLSHHPAFSFTHTFIYIKCVIYAYTHTTNVLLQFLLQPILHAHHYLIIRLSLSHTHSY